MNFLRLSQSPLAVELRLDQKEAVYTDLDTVTGEIILCSESPADISSIVLTLSGTATSRLNNGRRTESHNLFIKSSRIFPSDPLMKDLKRSSVTIGGGIHVLQFSITFPDDVIECHKSGQWPCWRRPKTHLLRTCPPSTGTSSSPAEIRFTLSVVVRGRKTVQKTRNISVYPLPSPRTPQSVYFQECVIDISPRDLDTGLHLSLKVRVDLLDGSCLFLNRAIPFRISLTKLGDASYNILLNGFQTMLVETTEVTARGRAESFTNTWTVQSTANMNYDIGLSDAPSDASIDLDPFIWANSPCPAWITSSFEACNIRKTHRLNVRLEFVVANYKPHIIIREFEFPVLVMGSPFTT